jgi:Flp pilus assembly protein TadB
MGDLKKAASEMSGKAAFAAAKNAAQRAVEDALLTEDERARRKAERTERAKKKRAKWIVLGVVALAVLLGVIGMALSYWKWFVLAGLGALVALYGRHRWRRYRVAARRPRAIEASRLDAGRAEIEARVESPVAQPRSTEPDTSVDDELAALKARVKKQG